MKDQFPQMHIRNAIRGDKREVAKRGFPTAMYSRI